MYDDFGDAGNFDQIADDHLADDDGHQHAADAYHDADDHDHSFNPHAQAFDHAGADDGGSVHAHDALGASASPHFAGSNVVGSPAQDMQVWHQQAASDTCAVVAQEFVLESLTGHSFTEQQLAAEAYQHGWYVPGGGTPFYHTGNLLEAHGLHVERHFNGTFEELAHRLANGEKVIAGVDGGELWTRGVDNWQDNLVGSYPGIPGQGANHAVEVIGIDYSNPSSPQVVLNDPGVPKGAGMLVPANDFMGAWADSGFYMVSASARAASPAQAMYPVLSFPSQPHLAGYYNADSTYHYSSDNTDRDPQTGAIVRRW